MKISRLTYSYDEEFNFSKLIKSILTEEKNNLIFNGENIWLELSSLEFSGLISFYWYKLFIYIIFLTNFSFILYFYKFYIYLTKKLKKPKHCFHYFASKIWKDLWTIKQFDLWAENCFSISKKIRNLVLVE